MTEANYDNNGGGDPNNGLGQGDGHNDMEMDARGMEDEANANNNGNVGNGTKNGEEGMQEKCGQVDEIYIGTLKLPVSPLGNASSGNFLTQKKNTAVTPILHDKKLSLNQGLYADSYADYAPARFASGLPKCTVPALSAGRRTNAVSVGQKSGRVMAAATSPGALSRQGVGPAAGPRPLMANGVQGNGQAMMMDTVSCVVQPQPANEKERVQYAWYRGTVALLPSWDLMRSHVMAQGYTLHTARRRRSQLLLIRLAMM
jgi:hypothetical protein